MLSETSQLQKGKLRGAGRWGAAPWKSIDLVCKAPGSSIRKKKYTKAVCLRRHLAEALGVDLIETENRVDDSTFWGLEKLSVDVFSLARGKEPEAG